MLNKLKIPKDTMDIFEIQIQIKNLGKSIALSDFTSSFITERRIQTMRIYIDLLENYNEQLKGLEQQLKVPKEKNDEKTS